jgi:hypothetical protein
MLKRGEGKMESKAQELQSKTRIKIFDIITENKRLQKIVNCISSDEEESMAIVCEIATDLAKELDKLLLQET